MLKRQSSKIFLVLIWIAKTNQAMLMVSKLFRDSVAKDYFKVMKHVGVQNIFIKATPPPPQHKKLLDDIRIVGKKRKKSAELLKDRTFFL
jgi:hypothetical protein